MRKESYIENKNPASSTGGEPLGATLKIRLPQEPGGVQGGGEETSSMSGMRDRVNMAKKARVLDMPSLQYRGMAGQKETHRDGEKEISKRAGQNR